VQLILTADPATSDWTVTLDGARLSDTLTPTAPTPGASSDLPLRFELPPLDTHGLDSARFIAVVLEDGDTLILSALRPRGARGQDRDRIDVVLPESRSGLQAFDPRLSTEYNAEGMPQRFGIELWLGEDPDGDQHPWRLAGEARTAVPLKHESLWAQPMSAHAGERSGSALYVLVSP
jgi:hypothetical protein